jgi:hypothetical protein
MTREYEAAIGMHRRAEVTKDTFASNADCKVDRCNIQPSGGQTLSVGGVASSC